VIAAGIVGGGGLGYKAADICAGLYFKKYGVVVKNGWRYSTEWGVAVPPSLKAAAFAKYVMFANTAAEAVYYFAFADGTSGKKYVIHFEANEIPEVSAFWSLTMYHGELPYNLVANSANRYVISGRTPGIKFNDDGSLDIFIQHQQPSSAQVSNWLPAPDGPMALVMRAYGPGKAIREGVYAPPRLTPTNN
jgi:hypothetical protein